MPGELVVPHSINSIPIRLQNILLPRSRVSVSLHHIRSRQDQRAGSERQEPVEEHRANFARCSVRAEETVAAMGADE